MDDLFVVGRLIFGGFLLFNGANHFLMNAMMVQYASAKGVPMPEVAGAVAGVLILVGGFCVLNETGRFLSNAALLGGTLMMFALPRPWPYRLELRNRVKV